MSLDAVIRRPDGQPLGSIKEVQQSLGDAFPGIQFAIEHGTGDTGQSAHLIAALLSLVSLVSVSVRVKPNIRALRRTSRRESLPLNSILVQVPQFRRSRLRSMDGVLRRRRLILIS